MPESENENAVLERHRILVHARKAATQASLVAAGAMGEHNGPLAQLASHQSAALLAFANSVEALEHHRDSESDRQG